MCAARLSFYPSARPDDNDVIGLVDVAWVVSVRAIQYIPAFRTPR